MRIVSVPPSAQQHEDAYHGYRHGEVVHATKGFGFIQPENGGKAAFVHITAVERAGLNGLNEGQKISYDVVKERGKDAAANGSANPY
jgi:CspA family cold shock protein